MTFSVPLFLSRLLSNFTSDFKYITLIAVLVLVHYYTVFITTSLFTADC